MIKDNSVFERISCLTGIISLLFVIVIYRYDTIVALFAMFILLIIIRLYFSKRITSKVIKNILTILQFVFALLIIYKLIYNKNLEFYYKYNTLLKDNTINTECVYNADLAHSYCNFRVILSNNGSENIKLQHIKIYSNYPFYNILSLMRYNIIYMCACEEGNNFSYVGDVPIEISELSPNDSETLYVRLPIDDGFHPKQDNEYDLLLKAFSGSGNYEIPFKIHINNNISVNQNVVTLAQSATAAPLPPNGVTATGGNAQAVVYFNTPTSDGGSPITSYLVTASPGGQTSSGIKSPILVTGLINFTPYTFTVVAINSKGKSISSIASNIVTPQDAIVNKSEIWKEPLTGIELVHVQGGSFQMGCWRPEDKCLNNEKPSHEVTVDGFWIGKYEVTQRQWQMVMNYNPSWPKNDTYPVEMVSWNEIKEFIRRLNNLVPNRIFRLPTEAEWEYAARSGGKIETYSGSNDVDSVAWYSGNSNQTIHPVGTRAPNGLGLFDMSGNVWEWVEDIYNQHAYSAQQQRNPLYNGNGPYRVCRGGSWWEEAKGVRTTRRCGNGPDFKHEVYGFRLVMTK